MSVPVSRKLVETGDGRLWVVVGNPDIGYTAHELTLGAGVHFKRSWQAVAHCHGDPAEGNQ